MKELKNKVIKTTKQFHINYSLHDIAEAEGVKILSNLGYEACAYGEDRRYDNVWEAGEDKPDCSIIRKKEKGEVLCLLDWKGKRSSGYMINKRAYDSYLKISQNIQKSVIIAMAKMDTKKKITAFKYFVMPEEGLVVGSKIMWDGNVVVLFSDSNARDFSKVNKFLDNI